MSSTASLAVVTLRLSWLGTHHRLWCASVRMDGPSSRRRREGTLAAREVAIARIIHSATLGWFAMASRCRLPLVGAGSRQVSQLVGARWIVLGGLLELECDQVVELGHSARRPAFE